MIENEPTSGSKFLSLPTEIRLDIFHYAENPFLSHVCRQFWQEMPSIPSYCKLAGLAAFGFEFDFGPETFDEISRERSIQHPLGVTAAAVSRQENHKRVLEAKRILQEKVISDWLSLSQLLRLRHLCLLNCAESVMRITGNVWTNNHAVTLKRYLRSVEEIELRPTWMHYGPTLQFAFPQQTYRGDKGWSRNLRWRGSTYKLSVGSHEVILATNIKNREFRGICIQPFSLAVQIPPNLFRLAAKFDTRAPEMLEALAAANIPYWDRLPIRSTAVDENLFGSPQRKLVSNGICQILDYAQHAEHAQSTQTPEHIIKDCLLSLLKFDITVSSEEAKKIPKSLSRYNHKKSTRHHALPSGDLYYQVMSKDPICIKPCRYTYVINRQNIPGLKLLMYHNWPVHNPSHKSLKEMIRVRLKQHLKDIGQPLTQRTSIEALFSKADAINQPVWENMWKAIEEAREHGDLLRQKRRQEIDIKQRISR